MENNAIKKEIDVSYILSNLITSPIIRIDRNEFLRSALSNYFNDRLSSQVQQNQRKNL